MKKAKVNRDRMPALKANSAFSIGKGIINVKGAKIAKQLKIDRR